MNLSKYSTHANIAAALLAGALTASMPARAAEHAYLKDGAGATVLAGGGGCVHTGRWKESMPTCPEPTLVVEEGQAMIVFAADDSEFFGFDSVQLSDQVKADLDSVVDAVKSADMIQRISVTGHADRIGPAPYNRELALRRAKAVKAYLVGRGIPADRIEALSDGQSDPLITCPGVKRKKNLVRCLAPNRRVDIEALLTDNVDIETVSIVPPTD